MLYSTSREVRESSIWISPARSENALKTPNYRCIRSSPPPTGPAVAFGQSLSPPALVCVSPLNVAAFAPKTIPDDTHEGRVRGPGPRFLGVLRDRPVLELRGVYGFLQKPAHW